MENANQAFFKCYNILKTPNVIKIKRKRPAQHYLYLDVLLENRIIFVWIGLFF